MGRPRKPTRLKKLQGTLQPCRTPKNEWTPPVGAPPMPAHFKGDAAREWQRVVPILLAAGLVSACDGSTLEAYCETYARWKDAARTVTKEGQVIDTPFGAKAHPAVKIENDARSQCMSYAQRFGLDPASRSRISTPAPKDTKDQAKEFLFSAGLQVVPGGKK
jgi:P27 family predicted phage terminase small subunit